MPIIFVAWLSLTSIALSTPPTPPPTGAIDLINANVERGKIEFATGEKTVSYKYCPNNTCEKITFAKNVKRELTDDMIIIYYGLVPGYSATEKFKTSQKEEIQKVVTKHANNCKANEKKEVCAARNLQSKTRPVIELQRDDEGLLCSQPLDTLNALVLQRESKGLVGTCSRSR